MIFLKKILLLTAMWLIYSISFFVPKNKNIAVFYGWQSLGNKEIFADNCKYLYLHLSDNKKIQTIWITKDKDLCVKLKNEGLRAHTSHSFRAIYFATRAHYTFIDAVMKRHAWMYSCRSKIIQLWHGRAIKKIDLYKNKTFIEHVVSPNRFVNFYLTTSSSAQVSKLMTDIFPKTPIKVTGYPRTDSLTETSSKMLIDSHNKIITEIETSNFKKIILYAPTFRRTKKELEIHKFITGSEISYWLKKNNFLLLLSFHPKYIGQLKQTFNENIRHLETRDIYPLLKKVDVLITDYSSLFTDFLLLDKQIIFFPYDLDDYSAINKITVNYEDHMPGDIAYTEKTLLNLLDNKETNLSKEKRLQGKNYYHDYLDGNSSQRIENLLFIN